MSSDMGTVSCYCTDPAVLNCFTSACSGQEEIYIPPPRLAFRILSYVTQKVIFSRTHREPQVGHHPSSETYSDHWFTLLHGSGAHAGLYAIKSRHTGKVLFSRRAEPGHVEGNGKYGDNWFKIEPGKGQYAKCFRLITPSQGMALFSRSHLEPYMYNHPSSEVYADHHFSFLFEDMQIDKIDYDINLGHILSSTPIVLADQTLVNASSQVQEMSFSVYDSVMNTSMFEYSIGFTIRVGTEFSASVPLISDAKLSTQVSSTRQWAWGKSQSYTVPYTSTFPVKAGPGETVHAVSTVNQGLVNVPFTVHLRSKSTGIKVETKGNWHGLTTWDLRHTTETARTDD